jgi:Protein of unknown function (DUF1302)
MVSTQRRWLGKIAALGIAVVVLSTTAAHAIFLDEDQNISLRARIYSQAAIRTEDSQQDTVPVTKAGQLVQNRNFYNPELDAKLTSYTKWMRGGMLDWLAPDDFRFRLAAWGFYDGIYDYGSSQFDEQRERVNPNFGNYSRGICSSGMDKGKRCSSNLDCAAPGACMPAGAWYLEGSKVNLSKNCPANPNDCFVNSVNDLFPGAEVKNPYDIYALQRRINELYLSYTKGPFFLRFGKQGISWGESDTIALLDQSNPFDVTLGAPGIFQDLDEARIPLWTVRSSYNLFETLGPFSSGFVEAYWVPGQLDTNTGWLPMLTVSPYSPRGRDPQFSTGFPNETFQFVLFDHVPERKFSNSRYGFRFQTVINRAFTVQAWMYTTFPNSPVPRHLAPAVVRPGTQGARTTGGCSIYSQQGCSPLFAVETVHKLTTVYGVAGTFFSELLDSIVRMNVQLFENEPGFIPQLNLNIKCAQVGKYCSQKDVERDQTIGTPGAGPVTDAGSVPVADIIRWELGFDRFFFIRALNPTNSFTMSLSQVGAWNLDETGRKDFRYAGQRKPGTDDLVDENGRTLNPVPNNFVQQKAVEAFAQITLLTDYMHGRLSPQMTYIQNVRGTYALHPQVTYRWSDSLLFRLDYVHIGGEYEGLGFFRDRDQVALRATYQLN